jgi:hypothetical protein
VAVGVSVGVTVGVFVDVDVGVLVGVRVGVFVGVLLGVVVGVRVGVLVGVVVGVMVGVWAQAEPGTLGSQQETSAPLPLHTRPAPDPQKLPLGEQPFVSRAHGPDCGQF